MEPRIERLISFIKSKFEDGIQMFNTPSMAGDFRVPIYSKDEIAVLWVPYYEYIEIYGISDVEFATVMKETNGYD